MKGEIYCIQLMIGLKESRGERIPLNINKGIRRKLPTDVAAAASLKIEPIITPKALPVNPTAIIVKANKRN